MPVPKQPCKICKKQCNADCLQCQTCDQWIHYACESLTRKIYKTFTKLDYICVECRTDPNTGQFDFLSGLHLLKVAAETGINALKKACTSASLLLDQVPCPQIVDDLNTEHVSRDEISHFILSEFYGTTMKALVSTPNGDCMFNAVSTMLVGSEILAVDLRYRCCVEMTTHSKRILGHPAYRLLEPFSPEYNEDCLDCAFIGRYQSVWHMMALSNLLGITIESVYPCVNGCKDLAFKRLNRVFTPESQTDRSKAISLMWTNIRKPVSFQSKRPAQVWTPNHFVPLVEGSDESMPTGATSNTVEIKEEESTMNVDDISGRVIQTSTLNISTAPMSSDDDTDAEGDAAMTTSMKTRMEADEDSLLRVYDSFQSVPMDETSAGAIDISDTTGIPDPVPGADVVDEIVAVLPSFDGDDLNGSFNISNRILDVTDEVIDDPLSDRSMSTSIIDAEEVHYDIFESGTKRGGKKLVGSDGFSYTVKRSSEKQTYWVCSIRGKQMKCSSSVTQRGDIFIATNSHVHPCDPGVGKRTQLSATTLMKLKDMLEETAVEAAVLDFETGAWSALRQVFPDIRIKGCLFHWVQCIWRHVQEKGLQATYNERQGVYVYIRKLMALPLLPYQHMQGAFQNLAQKANTTQLRSLVAYIDSQWFTSSVYPLRSISVYGHVIRTNNDVEGWHRRINKKANGLGLPFYVLIPFLLREGALVDTNLRLVQDGLFARDARKKYCRIQAALEKTLEKYSTGDISTSDFLSAASKMYGQF